MTDIYKLVRDLAQELPKFPDGRINYGNASKAAVLTCFIEYKGKILLLKRSDKVRTHQNLWSAVAGYLDDFKSIEEKTKEELSEEVGINSDIIKRTELGDIYKFTEDNMDMTWIVQPVLVTLKKKPDIRIDWEHTEYIWIHPKNITKYKIVPKIDKALDSLSHFLH